ncbi:MAG TPA: glucokinase [Paucimonas sp.]|nr:glucokinase [Paucimonas sp.]
MNGLNASPQPAYPAPPARTGRNTAFPRLLADIGGTNARFALELEDGRIAAVGVLPCKAYATLPDALRAYRQSPEAAALGAARARLAAFAIANPVDGDEVAMTNHHWRFSIEALRREFDFASLLVVNDFKALAMALPRLGARDLRQVGGGCAKPRGVLGLVGVGTGVGVSALVPAGDGWSALDSEGGHATFTPANEREVAILRHAWRHHPHVSAERLLAGIGLDIMYRALAELAGVKAEDLSVPQILERGLNGGCTVCAQTIECFCDILGTLAGNVALTFGAKGGIYIGGGIVPRLGERFLHSGFRKRFEQKGRLSAYLAEIPTYVITAEYPAFLGVAALLEQAAST